MSKIDNSKNKALQKVYTDKLGNDWYSLINVMDISPSRGVSAARAERYASLKISEQNLKQLLNVAIEGLNKNQDIVQAISILHELKHRTEFLCEENSLLDLSAIYYFLMDEDHEFPSEYHNAKKREIWEKDEACRGFFLHMALWLTKQFSNTVEEDLLKFMNETKDLANRIYQFIPKNQTNNS